MLIAVDYVSYEYNKYMEIHVVTYPDAEEIVLRSIYPGMNPNLNGPIGPLMKIILKI